jgi:hypothetical protein
MLLEMGRSRKMWKQRWWCSLVKTSGGAEGFGEGLEVAAKHRGRERGGWCGGGLIRSMEACGQVEEET